jgi:phage gp36-like protein
MLTTKDLQVLISSKELEAVEQADMELRAKAEAMAIEQIKSYLVGRYDTTAIFSQDNSLIKMYLADLMLFHLFASLPNRMGLETRQLRYDNAIRWLEQVATGKLTPDLPKLEPNETKGTISYGSDEKNSYSW